MLRRALRLGHRVGKVAAAPHVPRLREPAPRQGFFERAELDLLLVLLPDYVAPAAAFMSLTGWRKQETLGLTWNQVDFGRRNGAAGAGHDQVRRGPRVPIWRAAPTRQAPPPPAGDCHRLEERRRDRIPWVFPNARGGRLHDFRKSWARACKEAGLAGRIPHDFRRTAVRNLERAGVSRSVAMQLVGDKTEAIYRRYAIVAERDLKDGVARLAALHADAI